MSYDTDTILSATPSTDLMTVIEAELTAHPAWEFVESHVDGSYTNRIWKCLGSANDWGVDYYVAFMRLTASIGTAPIIIEVAEDYNTSTHVATRGIVPPGSTLTPNATDASAYGSTTYAFSHANWNKTYTLTTTTTAFVYHIVATNNALVLMTSASTYPVYVGLFTPLWAADFVGKEFPLFVAQIGFNDVDGSGSFTRNPPLANVSSLDAFAAYVIPQLEQCRYQKPIGRIGVTGNLSGTKLYGAQVLVGTGNSSVTEARGYLPDALMFAGSAPRGDTMTIDGDVWVSMYNISGTLDGVATNLPIFFNTEV